ncbi:MAG: hypothetical protein FWC41_05920 [Firmicutes bacterium]|nr:hypothetical protein [Bacillota bacterium]
MSLYRKVALLLAFSILLNVNTRQASASYDKKLFDPNKSSEVSASTRYNNFSDFHSTSVKNIHFLSDISTGDVNSLSFETGENINKFLSCFSFSNVKLGTREFRYIKLKEKEIVLELTKEFKKSNWTGLVSLIENILLSAEMLLLFSDNGLSSVIIGLKSLIFESSCLSKSSHYNLEYRFNEILKKIDTFRDKVNSPNIKEELCKQFLKYHKEFFKNIVSDMFNNGVLDYNPENFKKYFNDVSNKENRLSDSNIPSNKTFKISFVAVIYSSYILIKNWSNRISDVGEILDIKLTGDHDTATFYMNEFPLNKKLITDGSLKDKKLTIREYFNLASKFSGFGEFNMDILNF